MDEQRELARLRRRQRQSRMTNYERQRQRELQRIRYRERRGRMTDEQIASHRERKRIYVRERRRNSRNARIAPQREQRAIAIHQQRIGQTSQYNHQSPLPNALPQDHQQLLNSDRPPSRLTHIRRQARTVGDEMLHRSNMHSDIHASTHCTLEQIVAEVQRAPRLSHIRCQARTRNAQVLDVNGLRNIEVTNVRDQDETYGDESDDNKLNLNSDEEDGPEQNLNVEQRSRHTREIRKWEKRKDSYEDFSSTW